MEKNDSSSTSRNLEGEIHNLFVDCCFRDIQRSTMSSNVADTSSAFELTEEERGWAMMIKKTLMEADEGFAKQISDLEYAQNAIVAKEKVSLGIKRIRRLKAFREEYGIPNNVSLQEAKDILRKFDDLCPGFFLGFGTTEKGQKVATCDYKAFLPAKFQTQEDWRVLFVGLYFWLEATQSDLVAIRQGMVWICDCKGLGWKNFSLEAEKKAAHLYQDAYPVRIRDMTLLNSSPLLKVLYTLCKPFLSKRIKELFHMDGNLTDVQQRYKRDVLPTTMGGTQSQLDMAEKLIESLEARFECKAAFRL